MQFHLDADELKFLADILLEQKSRQCGELLNKVLRHDLRLDCTEFEQAAELLAGKMRSLQTTLAQQPEGSVKADLQKQLALLERVLEKVNEACVMF
jgi:hypothetical protein